MSNNTKPQVIGYSVEYAGTITISDDMGNRHTNISGLLSISNSLNRITLLDVIKDAKIVQDCELDFTNYEELIFVKYDKKLRNGTLIITEKEVSVRVQVHYNNGESFILNPNTIKSNNYIR